MATGGYFLLLVKLFTLFQAMHELIPDSHKSPQVQYNRAKSLIIPILLQDFLNEYNCSNNVAKAPKTNSLDKVIQTLHNEPLSESMLSSFVSDKLLLIHKSVLSLSYFEHSGKSAASHPATARCRCPRARAVFKQAIKMNYYQTQRLRPLLAHELESPV